MNPTPCPTCGGSGMIKAPSGIVQMCPMCEGTGDDPGIERFFTYTTGVISLIANQFLPAQRVVIRGDAPFRIKLLTRLATGSFRIRLFDSTGQYFSSGGEGATLDRIPDVCLFGDGSLPFLLAPYVMIPAGGTIGYDIEDTSGAPNNIQIAFHGAKVYPTPKSNT